jgi:hypothetical protein
VDVDGTGRPDAASGRTRVALALALVAAVLVTRAPTFSLPFFQDDYVWVHPVWRWGNLIHPVVGQIAIGPRLVWAGLLAAVGPDPGPHYVAYAVACATLAVVVWRTLEALGVRSATALPAALAAVCVPSAAFGYVWLSSWGHLLATLGLALAAWAVAGQGPPFWRALGATVVALIAVTSKQSAVCGAVVLPLVALASASPRDALRVAAAPAIALAAFGAAHVGVMWFAPSWVAMPPLGAPAVGGDFLVKLARATGVLLGSPLAALMVVAAFVGGGRRGAGVVLGLLAALAPVVAQPTFDPLEGGDTIGRVWLMACVWWVAGLAWAAEPFARRAPWRRVALTAGVLGIAALGAWQIREVSARTAAQTASQVADVAAMDVAAARGDRPLRFAGWMNDHGVLDWYVDRAARKGTPLDVSAIVLVGADGADAPWTAGPTR